MKISKEQWKQELLSILTAPSFFVYILGLVLMIAGVFVPALLSTAELTIAEGDSVGAMTARYFASMLGTVIMFLTAFSIAAFPVRDKARKIRDLQILDDSLDSKEAVLVRLLSNILMMFLPIIIAALVMIAVTNNKTGCISYITICFTWLLPTLAFMVSFALAITEWTGLVWPAIVSSIIIWVFSQGSTADVADYNSCLAVRHEILGGFAEYKANIQALAVNRVIVLVLALAFTFVAIAGNKFRRNHKR